MHQRLDADTSGVLLFAARREANKALAAAFEGRSVRKVYLALVHGAPSRAEGVIDAPIVREHGERYRTTTSSDPRGLAARTRYRVMDYGAGARSQESGVRHQASRSAYSLLELIPETGRPHQIRVHLAHIGCPVVGDPLYGPTDRPAPRLYLHAFQLTLPHPATGQPVTFTAGGNLTAESAESAEFFISSAPSAMTLKIEEDAARDATARESVILSGLTTQSQAGRNPGEGSLPDQRDPALALSRHGNWVVVPLRVTTGAFLSMKVPHIRAALAAPDALRALLRLAVARAARPWRPIRKRTYTG